MHNFSYRIFGFNKDTYRTMLTITKGDHHLPTHGLTYRLDVDLRLQGEKTVYFLRGENGAGKSSFLKHFVVPGLRLQSTPFLYVGQDLAMQVYPMRAVLGVLDLPRSGPSPQETVLSWLETGSAARVLILDEYDKYVAEVAPAVEKTGAFIETLIMVSHTAPEDAEQTLRHTFSHGRELFLHKHRNTGTSHVQVTERVLW
ncbi:MAG TPA: hypothetical protein VJ934_08600 [Desulfomicrobiaceae bacterium]|nr:hypothetical protein [Desulfomicrobiaceae bacterium]